MYGEEESITEEYMRSHNCRTYNNYSYDYEQPANEDGSLNKKFFFMRLNGWFYKKFAIKTDGTIVDWTEDITLSESIYAVEYRFYHYRREFRPALHKYWNSGNAVHLWEYWGNVSVIERATVKR
jgi:hypothetical protein